MKSETHHFIDAHCHLSDARYNSILENVLNESFASHIAYFIQGGTDPKDWSKQRELKSKIPHNIFTVYGIHPWTVIANGEAYALSLLEQLRHFLTDAVALGEIGLDYSPRISPSTFNAQEILFKHQIDLAKTKNLPVVIHAVRSHTQIINILNGKGFGTSQAPSHSSSCGIIHGFCGPLDIAQEYINLGFALSLGAAATQKKYQPVLKELPINSIVIESDAPDMLPHGLPHGFLGSYTTVDGKPLNTPKSIWFVAEVVGKAKGLRPEEVLFHSKKNAAKIFNLKFMKDEDCD